jgi:hypothetical protein
MSSTLGVVAGLLATHASASKIVAASIGIAVAATVGMGAGQYLSDGQRNQRNALAAALIGHYRGYVVTYAILIVVSLATVGLSIAVA